MPNPFLPPVGATGPAGRTAAVDPVPTINPRDFARVVGQGRVVVEFYSPACAFCQKAMPEVERVAEAFNERGVRFVKINLLDPLGMQLGQRYGLREFPTFAVFENGQHKGTFHRQGNKHVTAQMVAQNTVALLGG